MPDLSAKRPLLPRLAAGIYAWTYAVLLGLVILDVVYARELQAALGASIVDGIFTEISDFLLFPLAFLMLTGVAAWLAGRRNRVVRHIVPVSLLFPVSALLLIAVAGAAIEQAGLGSALRVLTFLAGSILAMRAAIAFAPTETRFNP